MFVDFGFGGFRMVYWTVGFTSCVLNANNKKPFLLIAKQFQNWKTCLFNFS